MKLRFVPWLTVLLVLVAASAGLGGFVWAQGADLAAAVIVGVGQLLTYGWAVFGLWRWRHVGWVAAASRLLILTMAAALLGVTAWALGRPGAAIVFAGAWGMAVVFTLGLALLRLVFTPGYGVLGVARTLVDEAIRMRLGLIFVVGLVLLLPVLPSLLGGETRLQYRLESFLTYALTLTSVLLSAMTILLAVRTVSAELGERQAYLTLTKPVSRGGYLAGKWVGIMSLNLLLLATAGVGIGAFTRVLERQPAMDLADAVAAREQVLTARASAEPVPVDASVLAVDFAARLTDLRARGVDPTLYGSIDDPVEIVRDEARQRIQLDAIRTWLTVEPRGQTTYRFTGLAVAKAGGRTLQLRYHPKAATAAGDNLVRLDFRVNGRPYVEPRTGRPLPPLRNATFHVAYFTPDHVNDAGELNLTILNTGADVGQTAVAFKPGEGLELFYRVGGFEGNLARGLGVMWVRLGFLAALGLAAATFLSFPVACLACFLVFFAAVGSDYLSESLRNYASVPRDAVPWWDKGVLSAGKFVEQVRTGEYYEAFKLVIRLVGEAFTLVVPPLSRYSPTPLVAYGRAIEPPLIGGVLLRIGLISTGVVAVLGLAVFGRREVARVTV
ncbi:MAG: hypothetical protein AAF710_07025 [Planctomycetota bacterium]